MIKIIVKSSYSIIFYHFNQIVGSLKLIDRKNGLLIDIIIFRKNNSIFYHFFIILIK